MGKVPHQHNGHYDLIGRQSQEKRQQNDPIHPQGTPRRLQKTGAVRQNGAPPYGQVRHEPQQQSGRGRRLHRPRQHKQRPVKDRADDDLPPLGPPVGRQLQRKGGRHAPQHRPGKEPGHRKGGRRPQQDKSGQQQCGKNRLPRPRRRSHKKEQDKIDQRGEPPIAGDKAVGQDGQQPFPRRINDAAAHHPGGIAAKPHADGKGLLAAGTAAFQRPVQVVGHPGQVTHILQQGK